MRLLRKHSPRLQPDALAGLDTAGLLNGLQGQISELVAMLGAGSGARIGDILRFMRDNNLMAFDDRYVELIDLYAATPEPVSDPATDNAALRFNQCDASELWGYRNYIEKMSPFATQQGIKGAELDKVIVVVDDEEGRTNTFSYGKYFGVTPLSATGQGHMDAKRDSVIDRTRRLFYLWGPYMLAEQKSMTRVVIPLTSVKLAVGSAANDWEEVTEIYNQNGRFGDRTLRPG